MNKKFVINLGLLLILNFLVKPFYILGIDAGIQNEVGPIVYGEYFSLLGFSFLLNIILDVGIVNYNTRNIAQHNFLLQKYFGHIIGLRLMLSLFYAVVTLVLAFALGYDAYAFFLLGWLIINQILASLILYVRSNLSGLLLFKRDSIISVLDRGLLILICGLLLWGNVTDEPFKIEWFIYAQTFAYGITLVIALLFLLTKQKVSKLKLKKTVSLTILKQSLPFALLILLMTIYYRADSVMLERMLDDGKTQAGIYANGFRFFEAANNFALLFATLLLPLFSNLLKNKKSVESLVGVSSRILLSGAATLAIICFFFQEELIAARYLLHNREASSVFGILMMCFFFISCTYIFGTLLTANGNLKTLNKIAFAGVVLNIVLNIILIPTYKAYGAALASLITQAATAVAQLWLAKRYFNLKTNIQLLGSFLLYVVILTGILWSLTYTIELDIKWYYTITVCLLLSVPLLFLTKIIKISHLKSLFSSFKTNRS